MIFKIFTRILLSNVTQKLKTTLNIFSKVTMTFECSYSVSLYYNLFPFSCVCVCICFSNKKKKISCLNILNWKMWLKHSWSNTLAKHFSFFGYNFQCLNNENFCLSLHINQALYISVKKFTIGVKYNYFFILILFVAAPLDTYTFPSNKFIFGVN